MSSDDKTPDEVEKLADALILDKASRYLGSRVHRGINQAELRTLARDAAAVGARTALEDARESLNVHAGIEGDDGVREGVRRWPLGNSHGYSVAITEALELLDDLRIEKYTTDEEKPDEG